MATTQDNSINQKKNEKTGTNSNQQLMGFIKNYLYSIIFTIGVGVFIIGGIGLYTSKVAQSNILPDDTYLAPFTNIDRIVKETPINMNIMSPSLFSDPKDYISQKAYFNSKQYLDSFKKGFLCTLKKYATPNSGIFANVPLYFSFVYDDIVATNFCFINFIFYYLNYLPESVIMLLYAIFALFFWLLLYLFNIGISIYYHIVNLPQLFRVSAADTWFGFLFGDSSSSRYWESEENISFFHFGKICLFFFLYWWIALFSIWITPPFSTIYAIFAPLFATYKLEKTEKNFNVLDFLLDTIVYKKLFFFILATISLVSNGITYLGNSSILGIIIAIIFLYFLGLYNNSLPNVDTDGFTQGLAKLQKGIVEDINFSYPKKINICPEIPLENQNTIIQSLKKKMQSGGKKQTNKYSVKLV
jgi:hypothetical protein